MTTSPSAGVRWTCYIIKTLVVLFLIFDAVSKLMQVPAVIQSSAQMGCNANYVFGVGLTLAIVIVLYLIPATANFGALLLTAYLGGAIAIALRGGMPFAMATVLPVIFAVLVWAPVYLRDPRLRALLPGGPR